MGAVHETCVHARSIPTGPKPRRFQPRAPPAPNLQPLHPLQPSPHPAVPSHTPGVPTMSTSRPALAASLVIAPAGAAPAIITDSTQAQTVYHEVEPNDSKAQANVIGDGAGMSPGEMIVGETRCTSSCGLYG